MRCGEVGVGVGAVELRQKGGAVEATTGVDEEVEAAVAGAGDAAYYYDMGSYFLTGSIPEPATLTLLAVGGLALLRRRRGYGG